MAATPSPFDCIQSTRLTTRCVEYLIDRAGRGLPEGALIGYKDGRVQTIPLEEFPRMLEPAAARPPAQWWMRLRGRPGPAPAARGDAGMTPPAPDRANKGG